MSCFSDSEEGDKNEKEGNQGQLYILANAGGVTVSYFEWVQNLQELLWSEEEISGRLTRILRRSFAEVLNISRREKVDMRTAALILGIGRVAEATKLRGIYP